MVEKLKETLLKKYEKELDSLKNELDGLPSQPPRGYDTAKDAERAQAKLDETKRSLEKKIEKLEEKIELFQKDIKVSPSLANNNKALIEAQSKDAARENLAQGR